MNSTVLVAATHKRLGKAVDGTSTQVATCIINKWKAKINEKGIYNVRNPPRKGIEKLERGKTVAVYIILENLCNKALKLSS